MSTGLPRLGDILLESGAITTAQLDTATQRQKEHGGRLGTNLVELGFIDERTLSKVLSEQLRIPAATASQLESVDAWALARIPGSTAERLRAIPIREDGDRLWVAMADPTDRALREELEKLTGRAVRPMVAPELLIQYGLEHCYGIKRKPISSVSVQQVDVSSLEPAAAPEAAPRAAAPEAAPRAAAPEAAARAAASEAAPRAAPEAAPQERKALPVRLAIKRRNPVKPAIEKLAQDLSSAMGESDVLELAFRVVGQDAPRVVVLLVQDRAIMPWQAVGVDAAILARLQNVDEVPAIAQPLATGEPTMGTIPPSALGPLAPAVSPEGVTGLVVPIHRSRQAIGCMLGLEVVGSPRELIDYYGKLAVKLNHALCMIYYRRLLSEA
jgi:hypothetical protein